MTSPVSPTTPAERGASRPQRRTVRMRLALVYAGLFIASGAVLLAITYALAATRFPLISQALNPSGSPETGGSVPGIFQGAVAAAYDQAVQQRAAALRELLIESAIALAIMSVISIVLGWLIAGRILHPLRTITTAARRISATSLNERLALAGPDDELKELGDTFDALLSRLEQAFEAQRRFVTNASHELRTPLTRQRTMVEVALADRAATIDSLRATCTGVLKASIEQERLIEALLTLARSQRGLDQRRRIDLADIAGHVVRSRVQEVSRLGLTMSSALSVSPLDGDERLVERLITNLIDNAMLHNIPGGNIRISTRSRDTFATLSVANTGPVLLPTEMQIIFEPFRRLGSERTRSPDGLGLGLSIVDAIAWAHGATRRARALHDGGLEVRIDFPLATADCTSVRPHFAPVS